MAEPRRQTKSSQAQPRQARSRQARSRQARSSQAETPGTRANKAGALRWGVGAAIALLIGLAAWWLSDPRGEAPDLAPQHQPGYEENADGSQPPAVTPDQDPGAGSPPPAAPQGADGTTQ